MSNNSKDPLRLYLQDSRQLVCHCEHCFSRAIEWIKKPRSPIEVMMENAFIYVRAINYDSPNWEMHLQWPVLGYVADFVLITPEAKFVIECDGHDFHERTKEQARHDRSRDRKMVEAGWLVMRFTGSEIWSNPFACAEQVIDMAMNLEVNAHEAACRAGDQ